MFHKGPTLMRSCMCLFATYSLRFFLIQTLGFFFSLLFLLNFIINLHKRIVCLVTLAFKLGGLLLYV